jgi:hypothetical protein
MSIFPSAIAQDKVYSSTFPIVAVYCFNTEITVTVQDSIRRENIFEPPDLSLLSSLNYFRIIRYITRWLIDCVTDLI